MMILANSYCFQTKIISWFEQTSLLFLILVKEHRLLCKFLKCLSYKRSLKLQSDEACGRHISCVSQFPGQKKCKHPNTSELRN
ncbi:Uncharacterized protein TCM_036930 [Theobroma cacao]|uniref:Uncharacterized protein n=1 Tax=Theobroma cacao TaxID=3641 RepID=A0A061GIY1_THECC|nr:Uncharacterized protein TCM_036930 [Theobroma cacao]